MRIGVNLLFLYEITGIGVYAKNILENLGKIDKNNQYIIFVNSETKNDVFYSFQNFKYVELPFKASNRLIRIFFEQIVLPFLCLRYKITVLFNPSIFNPFLCFCKKIIVFHDFDFLYDKKKSFKNFYLKLNLHSAFKSQKIVTISNYIKNETISRYPFLVSKVNMIYNGLPKINNFFLQNITNDTFNIEKPYIFYIGLILPRKNIENLIRAFKIFSEKHKNFNLVLAGRIVEGNNNVEKVIEELQLKNKIKFIGYVQEKEKVLLYTHSMCLAFLSIREGFGLPILEAQSLGVPVLASNMTSLPEVGGDGALYVDPYNVEEIAKKMEEIVFNEKLRKKLIQKGYENIKRFSWEKSANELLNLFSSIW